MFILFRKWFLISLIVNTGYSVKLLDHIFANHSRYFEVQNFVSMKISFTFSVTIAIFKSLWPSCFFLTGLVSASEKTLRNDLKKRLRSSSEIFYQIEALKNFAKFQVKYLCRSFFLTKNNFHITSPVGCF